MSKRTFQPSFGATPFGVANYGAGQAPVINIPPGATQEQINAIVNASLRPPAEDEGYEEYISYFKQAAPALNQVLFGDDPRAKAAVMRVKLKAAQASYKKYKNVPLAGTYFKGEVDKLRAQLVVEEKKAKVEETSEGLGLVMKYGIVGLGVMGGLAMLAYINYIRVRTRAVEQG